MTNIEKLEYIGELDSVRGRLGAGEYGKRKGDLELVDKEINGMSNHQLIAKISGWELGDESWWNSMKGQFDELERLDKANAQST